MLAETDLDIVRENTSHELGQLLVALREAKRVEVKAAAVFGLSTLFRRIAICHLLQDADAPAFLRSLHASGRAYASLLGLVRWEALVDRYYLCVSRAQSFFDALAAGDFATAAEIAAGSAHDFISGEEDEDDFAWMRSVMATLGGGDCASEDAPTWVTRLERAAAPDDPRVAICRSLLAGPGGDDAFDMAMTALVSRRREQIGEERKSPNAEPEMLATEGHVYVEGAALCRLARLRGILVRGRYRLVPEATWTSTLATFPAPSAWQDPPVL
jgi:hypothetical protein